MEAQNSNVTPYIPVLINSEVYKYSPYQNRRNSQPMALSETSNQKLNFKCSLQLSRSKTKQLGFGGKMHFAEIPNPKLLAKTTVTN